MLGHLHDRLEAVPFRNAWHGGQAERPDPSLRNVGHEIAERGGVIQQRCTDLPVGMRMGRNDLDRSSSNGPVAFTGATDDIKAPTWPGAFEGVTEANGSWNLQDKVRQGAGCEGEEVKREHSGFSTAATMIVEDEEDTSNLLKRTTRRNLEGVGGLSNFQPR